MYKVLLDENGEEYLELDPEYQKKLIQSKYDFFLRRSNIPKDYWDIEFSDYKGNQKEFVDKLKYYSENPFLDKYHNVNIYLYGKQSTQKTMLACNIGKGFLKKGLIVKFVLAGELINKFLKLQGYSKDYDLEKEITELKNCDLLIIDDAFDNSKSIMWKNNQELIISEWDSFLRYRLSNDKRMIITSNVGLSSIGTNYGRSVYELLDRNFVVYEMLESIKEFRKKRLEL